MLLSQWHTAIAQKDFDMIQCANAVAQNQHVPKIGTNSPLAEVEVTAVTSLDLHLLMSTVSLAHNFEFI